MIDARGGQRDRTAAPAAGRTGQPSRTLLVGGALALLLFSRPLGAHAVPSRLDGVAALVGGIAAGPGVDVILRSDVELRAHLDGMRNGGELALGELPAASLAAALHALLGEHVIAREARRLQVVRASAADVADEKARMLAAAGGSERVDRLFAALGASLDELDAIASRRALVGAFLSANLEGASVTNGELERWVTQLRARTPLHVYATW